MAHWQMGLAFSGLAAALVFVWWALTQLILLIDRRTNKHVANAALLGIFLVMLFIVGYITSIENGP